MSVELSSRTTSCIERVFADRNARRVASELLRAECAENVPLWDDNSPEGLDRIRIAALKLSEGNLERLREAVSLAQTDWRDVLVAAGFGNDASAHLHWAP